MGFLSDLLDYIASEENWIDIMKERIREETKRMNSSLDLGSGLSTVAQEVQNIVLDQLLFGCQRGNVLRILSIVLKENIRDYRERISIPPFAIVKMRDRWTEHHYDLDKPYLSVGTRGGSGIYKATGPAGGFGDQVPNRRGSLKRVGEEEVEGFLKSLQISRFLRGVGNGFERNW